MLKVIAINMGKTKTTTERFDHHCPRKGKGPGKCVSNKNPSYCKTHQVICPNHGDDILHLKTEPCPSCASKERLKAKKEAQDRVRDNEEAAQKRIDNKGKKK